jgi:type VI secretion system protein ImpE
VTAKELFGAGKVREAQQQLSAYLRDHPQDTAQRTFLFELLCFSGDFDRAEKHLGILAEQGAQAEMGAVLYYAALHAERLRHDLSERQELPQRDIKSPAGKLNGRPFKTLRDADPDVGPRLEVFAAGSYLWIAFEHITSIEIAAPRRLRDTLWAPAFVCTGPEFKGTELGEVLIPALYPFSWRNADEQVWLGRMTTWAADEHGTEYPSGQRLLFADDEEVPFLEIRTLEFLNDRAAEQASVS